TGGMTVLGKCAQPGRAWITRRSGERYCSSRHCQACGAWTLRYQSAYGVFLTSDLPPGFYPEITDGCKRADSFRSCLATLRRILGLWNRSMYSNTSALAASGVGYVMRWT